MSRYNQFFKFSGGPSYSLGVYTACLNELFSHELPVFHIRFKEKHKISLYKTSAIDPKRADQASEEIAQAFEDLITSAITKMHEINPEEFPWKSLSEVPDCCLYNMDEVALKCGREVNALVAFEVSS